MKNPIQTGELVPQAMLDDHLILAAGPMSKQPGSIMYRVVLIASTRKGWDVEYSVHNQHVEDDNQYLSNGHYYGAGPDELVKATIKFSERVAFHAAFLRSIFREAPPA